MTNCRCTFVGIAISVVFSIVIGVLFFLALIPTITNAIIAALGIATTALFVLLFNLLSGNTVGRCCLELQALLWGSIGTIITSIIALAISLIAPTIFTTLLVVFVAFFFALTLTSIVCLFFCLSTCNSCSCL